ncbi:MAG: hypothetical protein KatS3mg118_2224 [Paracoccaceae bacterium]|nr:MAG: hypothetical protein KatS3mg118_2224 [Paracoccaceae bacterium]
MSWLSGFSAISAGRSGAQAPASGPCWQARQAGSAASRAVRAWWRTGNRTGRASGSVARSSCAPCRSVDAPDIVPGGEEIRPQFARGLKKVAELDALVAAHAGQGRRAGEIAVGEVVDHLASEDRFVIQHVVGNAQTLGHPPGVADVLPRAAGAAALHRRAVIVELQGDPITSWPSWASRAATTELSTPPDIATTTRRRPPGSAAPVVAWSTGRFVVAIGKVTENPCKLRFQDALS